MNLPDKRKSDLAPWNAAAVLQEIFSHAVLAAMAWFGGFGYLGLILVLSAELLIVNLLSTVIFRERGLWRHFTDLVKFIALMAFLWLFVVVTYGVAMEGEGKDAGQVGLAALLGLDRDLIAWGLGFSVVHLTAMLVYARTRPQPRKEWARLALMQSATTFVAMFCLIFVVAFLGPFAVRGARTIWADASGDSVLVLLAVSVRFGFALLVSRMPDKDLDQIAAKPYAD